MIRRKVSAVLQLRDSFLGLTTSGAGARCTLNGYPVKPEVKNGGLLVLCDVPTGRHKLTIFLPGFLPEELALEIAPSGFQECGVELKPGKGYPYRNQAVTAALTVEADGNPLSDAEIWIAVTDSPPLKLVQAEVAAESIRVFRVNAAYTPPIPGAFLLEDVHQPELLQIVSLENEEARLSAPLAAAHSRGKPLLRAAKYRTDHDGTLSLLLHRAGRLALFHKGRLQYAELNGGDSRLTVRF